MLNMDVYEKLKASEEVVLALKKRVRYLESSDGDWFNILKHSRVHALSQQDLSHMILRYASCGIMVLNDHGHILLANHSACQLLAYSEKELKQMHAHEVFGEKTWGDSNERVLHAQDKDIQVSFSISKGKVNQKVLSIAVFNDLRNEKDKEALIQALSTFPTENPQPVWRIDAHNGTILFMNQGAKEISQGWLPESNMTQRSVWNLMFHHVLESRQNDSVDVSIGERWFRCLFAYVNEDYMNVYGADITEQMQTTFDLNQSQNELEKRVTERTLELSQMNKKLLGEVEARKKMEEKLRSLSQSDALTGLGNRRMMSDRMNHAIQVSQRYDKRFALFFIDLDHFKEINDTLGHDAGDDLLIQVARRLEHSVRNCDTVIRLGGDEFSILLEDIRSESAVLKIAECVLDQLHEPFCLNHEKHTVHCSIGISFYPHHGKTVAELFKCADIALYKAKEVRNKYCSYSPEQCKKEQYLTHLSYDMSDALRKDQFQLLFQPKVRLSDGQVIGAEALLRWHHPKYGMISPLQFIPIAEANGVMVLLGEWVMSEACRVLKTWEQAGHTDLIMAINLSPIQLMDQDLCEKTVRCLTNHRLTANQIELEVTESMAISDPERTIQILDQLVAMGIKIALDDFGTGHSSLSRLNEMPIHTLKIDRAFISKLCEGKEHRVFVEIIVKMSKLLILNILAEGIETDEHAAFLHGLDCDVGQGYLYSRPISSCDFLKLLDKPRFTPQMVQDCSKGDSSCRCPSSSKKFVSSLIYEVS